MEKRIIRFFSIYLLSSGIQALISLLLLPVLTHFLTPGTLGIWVLLQTTAFFYLQLTTIGQNALIMEKGFESYRAVLFKKIWKINLILPHNINNLNVFLQPQRRVQRVFTVVRNERR